MKKIGFRLVLTVAFITLSVYLLYPTLKDYQNSKTLTATVEKKRNELKANQKLTPAQQDSILASFEDSIKVNNTDYKKARADRIKLGLDLQGGMRLVLEVNTGKLLEKLAQRKDSTFTKLLNESIAESNSNNTPILDLLLQKLKAQRISVKNYYGSVREDEDKAISDLRKQTEDAVSRASEIIRNRIDQYGVSEPSIQRQGDRRIIVELPGVAKEEEARQLLQGTALLEFKLVKDAPFIENIVKKIDNALLGTSDSAIAADTVKSAKQKTGPYTSLLTGGLVLPENKDKVKRLLERPEVRRITEGVVDIVFSSRPNLYPIEQGKKVSAFEVYYVNAKPELTGNVVTNATATLDQNSQNVVNMEMNTDGANEWARITGANINKRCAIILDNACFSAPVIRNRITGGRSEISGMANFDEANALNSF
jgi:preprotein translocase subunit SecD